MYTSCDLDKPPSMARARCRLHLCAEVFGGRVRIESDLLQTTQAERVFIGALPVDRLTFSQAIERIDQLVSRGGGAVFTPNVDHVVLAEEHLAFRATYQTANVCLADGMPVVWASRWLGRPVPEKVSGSDLIVPLMQRATERKWRVYLLGGAPGIAEKAAAVFRARGVEVVGVDARMIHDPTSVSEREPIVEKIRRAAPHVVLVALGAPKQELFIAAARPQVGGAVMLGIGASLDFVAGNVRRAPRWMSEHGLEWCYRLLREPRRLWRRYLLRDPKFFRIVWRCWREQRRERERLTGRRADLPALQAAARA
jgi:N-acetylglucosaminyldiphosphoundecaprenol N-acetyl-beta-D-mannosaminyltransferase